MMINIILAVVFALLWSILCKLLIPNTEIAFTASFFGGLIIGSYFGIRASRD